MSIPLEGRSLLELAARHGGVVRGPHAARCATITALAPTHAAGSGDLAPLLGARHVDDARAAFARGACLLVDETLAGRVADLTAWFHPLPAWAMAELLDASPYVAAEPIVGEGTTIGPGAVLLPGVRLGARVRVGAGAVVGAPGFGFARDASGRTRAIPQLGGVIVEDDVDIGPLCTVACGTIGPTVLRRGVKLDAQVHVGHNVEVGEGTVIAAQTGIAGSVRVGRGVLMGGQVGVADHVTIGDGARIAAKSGVIGDVPPGATVAGYPAVARARWLRALAETYAATRKQPRGSRRRSEG